MVAVVAAAGCRHHHAATTPAAPAAAAAQQPGADCRALARHGSKLIDAAPAAEREAATRLVATLIDLCQVPGL
ncbi:MAG TPA: hypothetical protein VHE35_26705, partial [Kofleriaceae bacterium]|nr:hypothetical protein [Kofleriaceae bacterium]